MRFMPLRAIFLFGFVIAMPVLALPPVARWVDEVLYGPPPADFGRPPASPATGEAEPPPLLAEQAAIAAITDRSPGMAALAAHGSDGSSSTQPPPLPPQAAFAPLVPLPQPAWEVEQNVDDRTIARLQQVRQRLEDLGAEYVIVEAVEGSGQYRFHCRMLVDGRSRFTRPFEASAADPIAAAEQVLRDVEAWRSAAAPSPVVR